MVFDVLMLFSTPLALMLMDLVDFPLMVWDCSLYPFASAAPMLAVNSTILVPYLIIERDLSCFR